jgi:hypothetical protein
VILLAVTTHLLNVEPKAVPMELLNGFTPLDPAEIIPDESICTFTDVFPTVINELLAKKPLEAAPIAPDKCVATLIDEVLICTFTDELPSSNVELLARRPVDNVLIAPA